MMDDPAQMPELIQRLLSRFDHLEYGLLRDNASELASLRDVVSQMQGERLAQEAPRPMTSQALSQAQVPTSHRWPGSLAGSGAAQPKKLPAPAQPPPVSIAEVNALELLV